ncbi:MAG: uracil-DNA glycosylase [Candidatus Binatia bacterium]
MVEKPEIRSLIADIKEQVLYLQELGVDSWDVSLQEQVAAGKAAKSVSSDPAVERFIPDDLETMKRPSQSNTTQTIGKSRLAVLPKLSKKLDETPETPETPLTDGARRTMKQPETSKPADALFDTAPTLNETSDTIESIRAEIGNCTRCELHAGRTQIVHSAGNFNADLMFVGEAPGADEDEQGFPFVGRAGQLLTKIIEGIGIKREDVFIGNINRCRPPGNRQPLPAETAACRPFLLREVAVVRPKVIVVMGNTATQNLLGIKTPISKLRGEFQEYFGVKVMPTFHPAYLLRDPHKKREVWEDMKKVRDYLASLQ